MIEPKLIVLPDAAAIANHAAGMIVDLAAAAINDHGRFALVLSGGSTPKTLYELLASDLWRHRVEWERLMIFFGDERTVPPDHAESNYRMANEALLSRVPVPPSRIFRMRGEIDPEVAAIEYGQLLKAEFADGGADLVLLGMGDDGHTASLFPHTAALAPTHHRCLANFVPRLNTWRLTLSVSFINQANNAVFMVAGVAKSAPLREVLEGPRDPERLPAQMIQPKEGALTWLIDIAAADMHHEE